MGEDPLRTQATRFMNQNQLPSMPNSPATAIGTDEEGGTPVYNEDNDSNSDDDDDESSASDFNLDDEDGTSKPKRRHFGRHKKGSKKKSSKSVRQSGRSTRHQQPFEKETSGTGDDYMEGGVVLSEAGAAAPEPRVGSRRSTREKAQYKFVDDYVSDEEPQYRPSGRPERKASKPKKVEVEVEEDEDEFIDYANSAKGVLDQHREVCRILKLL